MKTTKFVFFGGKGGVGKTTCAAARAVSLARRGGAGRVLAVSTDPAHSLGDAFARRLSARPSRVAGVKRLDAVELDAPRAFRRWIAEHGAALGDAIEHGTWLDRADVAALLRLPVPGVDELVGLLEIVRLAQSGYQTVVVDTAPTGHTLRLLASPDAVAAVAGILDSLQAGHREIRERFGAAGRREAADRLIDLLAAQARDTGALLRDRSRTSLHWVMLAEDLSLAETADAMAALTGAAVPVSHLVINRVIPPGPPCAVCDRRRADGRRVIAAAVRRFGAGRVVTLVPALPVEPRGLPALSRLTPTTYTSDRGTTRVPAAISASSRANDGAALLDAIVGDARLVFVGGKGGVGKTTVAAAVAIQAAQHHPARRVLVLSTDPAHSLGDVFGATVGDGARPVAGGPRNLRVRELDAPAALAARRGSLEGAIQEILATFGADAAGGRGVSELVDLAPPGIDELFGLISVSESFGTEYDTVIVDTAPTGHALRLLELPDAAREWVQVLLRVLLKYRELVRPGQLAAELVTLSRQVRTLQELLRDPAMTRFVVVTRAAALPRLETRRLLSRLRRLHVAAPVLFVNGLTLAPGRCPLCRATAQAERRHLVALTRESGRRVIIQAPLAAPPPRSAAALQRWAGSWIS